VKRRKQKRFLEGQPKPIIHSDECSGCEFNDGGMLPNSCKAKVCPHGKDYPNAKR